MSFQSTEKHSPHVDEELKSSRHNGEAGTRHDGRPEEGDMEVLRESGEGSPGPKEDPHVGVRAEVARFLGPAAFPGNKGRLIAVARDHNVTDDVLRLLDDLPSDRTFETTQDVVDALPHHGVHPDTEFEA